MARKKIYDGDDRQRNNQAVKKYRDKRRDALGFSSYNLALNPEDKALFHDAAKHAGLSLREFIIIAVKEKIARSSDSPAVSQDTADGSRAADDTGKHKRRKKEN